MNVHITREWNEAQVYTTLSSAKRGAELRGFAPKQYTRIAGKVDVRVLVHGEGYIATQEVREHQQRLQAIFDKVFTPDPQAKLAYEAACEMVGIPTGY